MKIKFEKQKESVLNTLFLKLEYMSGDADAYEYEEVSIPGVNYTNYLDNLDIIKKEVDNYKIISKFTDCNDQLCLSHGTRWGLGQKYNISYDKTYDYIKEKYSEDLADMYDNVPSDSTCQGRIKAFLSNILLYAYNEKGELLISYC